MNAAVNRLIRALDRNEKILIYGDYDVDGITATALLTSALNRLGGCVNYFFAQPFSGRLWIAERSDRGLPRKGYTLIITVDCGINAEEEVLFSHDLGGLILSLPTTITSWPKKTQRSFGGGQPPLQEGCTYPWKSLAGVGG